MKKIFCVVLAVLLIVSVAEVAIAAPRSHAGLEEISCIGLSSEYKLYKTAEYSKGSEQFNVFQNFMTENGIEGTLDHVYEFEVWDEHLAQWISSEEFADSELTISTAPGFHVLHHSGLAAGVDFAGTSDDIFTDSGLGLFAFITPVVPEAKDKVDCEGLPNGASLYKTAEYGEGGAQFDMFKQYLVKNGIKGTLDHVSEYEVWDEHLMDWISSNVFEDKELTISTTPGFQVLHNSVLTGGVEYAGTSDSFTTTNGLGLFAFIKPVVPEAKDKVDCIGLTNGRALYKTAEYGEGGAQFNMFKEYMAKNGIKGMLDHVYELEVWDEPSSQWIPSADFAGTALTISTTPGFQVLRSSVPTGQVLRSSVLTGGVENLGDSGSFVTTNGLGFFAFVKPEAQPAETATATEAATEAATATPSADTKKAPKTGDESANQMAWLLFGAALSTALVFTFKRSRKAEK